MVVGCAGGEVVGNVPVEGEGEGPEGEEGELDFEIGLGRGKEGPASEKGAARARLEREEEGGEGKKKEGRRSASSRRLDLRGLLWLPLLRLLMETWVVGSYRKDRPRELLILKWPSMCVALAMRRKESGGGGWRPRWTTTRQGWRVLKSIDVRCGGFPSRPRPRDRERAERRTSDSWRLRAIEGGG